MSAGILRHFRLVLSCLAVILGLAAIAGPASAASPPRCHGLKATIWSKSDAPKTVNGTDGPDVIVTGGGDDTINGNRGRDVICSHGGNDVIYGGFGPDRIYSGSGDDFITGSTGDDVLCAYAGRDGAFGGGGDDWISVGSGVNFYDADGVGMLSNPDYQQWISDGYTYSVGMGSGKDDVMTGNMIHVVGAKLAKRWRC